MATLDDYINQSKEILDQSSDEVKTLLSRIKAENLYPPFLQKITGTLQTLLDNGSSFWATCGERTFDEQHAIYLIGRRGVEGEHIKTTVDAGQSAHNYALACDFAYDLDPDRPGLQPSWEVKYLKLLADQAESDGLEAGLRWVSFPDGPHIQMPIKKLSISPRNQLLKAYKEGGKLSVFQYLDEQNWE